MNIKEFKISLKEYKEEELNQEEKGLMENALKASVHAYAPYSNFHVGAAVLLEDGTVILGSNQENAAYPSGLCAERVALFYAQSQYPDIPVKALAITAVSDNFSIDSPVSPCGACRQVIAETEFRHQKKIKIIMKGQTGPVYIADGIETLLPLSFYEEKLQKKASQ